MSSVPPAQGAGPGGLRRRPGLGLPVRSAMGVPLSDPGRPRPAGLRGILACTWTRSSPADGSQVRVVPDACVDLVWREDGLLQVAGPDTGPVGVRMTGRRYVGARFRPGAAPSLLKLPASAL